MTKKIKEADSVFYGLMQLLRMGLFFALLLSIFLTVPVQTVFAQTTGSINGTVRGPGGTPVAGVIIFASSYPSFATSLYATSAADGTYTITGLPAGSYLVYASGNGWVTQYYNHADQSTATPVSVTSGVTTSGINFDLVAGATITGTVRGPGGTPAAGETVYAASVVSAGFSSGVTAANGTYTITGLPAGSYLVYTGYWCRQYYNNATDRSMATAVTVTSGGTTSGIDLNLVAGGTIAGTVRGPDGTPVAGAQIVAGDPMLFNGGFATTAADGTYTITGLVAGIYPVASMSSGYANQYYNNAYSSSTATAVVVTNGGTTSNINFNLVVGGTISGTVRGPGGTPVASAFIYATNTATGSRFGGMTNADGTYTISGLPAGSYLVFVTAFATTSPQFYNNAYSVSTATPVTVTGGATMSGIDFNMVTPSDVGTIQGRITVTGIVPVPCQGCIVQVYDAASRNGMLYPLIDIMSGVLSSSDGSYETPPLPTGSYKVGVLDIGTSKSYYWPGTINIDEASLVPVTTGAATPNINIELKPFKFTDQTGVARSTVVTSNSIFVTWISPGTTTSISITGGEYSVNGGAYTSASGTVDYGNSVKARLTSSSSYAATTNATLTIGGISDTFSVTNVANTAPVITAPPTGGTQGTSITINGSNFGAVQGGSYVDFNGVQGTVAYWSDTQIVVIVPPGATSGSMRVVTSQGTSSNMSFTVYPPECAAPVKVAGGNYYTIQDAYNNAATGSTVQITEGLFNTGNLEFNRAISTRVDGGYNCEYNVKTGYSTVDGSVTIKGGSVTVEGLIIK